VRVRAVARVGGLWWGRRHAGCESPVEANYSGSRARTLVVCGVQRSERRGVGPQRPGSARVERAVSLMASVSAGPSLIGGSGDRRRVAAGTVQPWGPMSALPEITIDDALDRFLDAQRPRLAPRGYRRYE
jgi:hypothetical protein